jgi:tetratricopeptide (TPR) repeat protein
MSRRSKCKLPGDTKSSARSVTMASQSGNPFQPEVQLHNRWLSFAVCLFLALAVWAVFGQTLRYEFVNYDDDIYVYDNPAITQGLSLHGVVWTFTHADGPSEWLPLTAISRMLDWQLYGPNAGGHHLTNVLFHGATTILLFLVLRKMTGTMWRSAFVAAVFAIHPLRVESVAWVTERKDVLSGLFFMLTLWMWARYAQKRSRVEGRESNAGAASWALDPRRWTLDYYLALAFFALGLLSKTMLVTLPFVLLLLDYWPLNRLSTSVPRAPRPLFYAWLGLILEKVPFLLLSGAACVTTVLTQKHEILAAQGLTFPWRIGNALVAYADYLGHMIYPVGLALIYPHSGTYLSVWRVGLSVLVLFIISTGIMAGRRKHPYLLTGWLWYLGMLVPVIDIMQVGDQVRADRYAYLPQIGLYILMVWGVVELCGSWRYRRAAMGSVAGVILASLLAGAYVQTAYWKNSVSLWTHTLAYTPQSSVAHCNLGIALADQGKLDEAIQHFDRALQLNPDDAKALNNLGKVLTTQGKLDEAIQYFDRALQLNPDDAKALNNLGVALAAQGKLDEAVQHYEQALQLKPDYVDADYNLGNVLVIQGKLDEAAQYYEQVLQLKPDFAEAHCNLGLVLARQGKLDEAVQHFERALQLKPNNADTLNNLGGVLAAQGKLDEAAQYYEQALQLKPNNADALNNLGVALVRQGRLNEAIQHFERALQLNPDNASTHNNLGIALVREGKLNEAIQHFQQALNLAAAQGNTALAESIRTRLKFYQPVLLQPQTP